MTTLELEKGVALKNLLVATDFSEISRHALEYAAVLARHSGARIHIAHVLPADPFLPIPLEPTPMALDGERESAERSLEELATIAELRDVAHEILLERGPVAEVVSRLIASREIDLMVLGTRGRGGLKKIVLGSVAEELFRSASCPVVTVGPRVPEVPGRELDVSRVIFATDFSPASTAALPYAIAIANEYRAQLVLLHMVNPMPLMDSGTTWCLAADVAASADPRIPSTTRRSTRWVPGGSGIRMRSPAASAAPGSISQRIPSGSAGPSSVTAGGGSPGSKPSWIWSATGFPRAAVSGA